MKRKIFNTLKHKLQWLVLLTALLGMSQGVWADYGYWTDNAWKVYFTKDGSSYDSGWKGKNTNVDLGEVSTLKLRGFGVRTWGSGPNQMKVYYNLCDQNYNNYSLSATPSGDYDWIKSDAWDVDVISSCNPTNGQSKTIYITFKINDSSSYELTRSITFTYKSPCTNPSSLAISTPGSDVTLRLNGGTTPSTSSQSLVATCSNGDTYLWTVSPSSIICSTASGTETPSRATISNSGKKSASVTFSHEGVYTANFAAGCSTAEYANVNASHTITVKPGTVYLAGPLVNSKSTDNSFDNNCTMTRNDDTFTYEWYVSRPSSGSVGFTIKNSTRGSASYYKYLIPTYATIDGGTTINRNSSSPSNHDLSPNTSNITFNAGDHLKLTAVYSYVSNTPKYTISLEKICNGAPLQDIIDVLNGTKIWFYAGVDKNWDSTSDVYLNNGTSDVAHYSTSQASSTICSGNVKASPVMLPSAIYYISNKTKSSWVGNQMASAAQAGKVYVSCNSVCDRSTHGVAVQDGISISNLKFDNGNGGTTKTVSSGTNVSIFAQSATTATPFGDGLKIKYYVKKSGESTYYTECDWEASVANTTGTTGTLDTGNLEDGEYTVYALLMNATNATEAVKASTTLTLTINSCTPPEASNFTVTSGTNTYVYNGSAHSATVTGVSPYTPSNIVAYYGANSSATATSQTDAGTYNIYVHSADAYGDYCAVTSTITTELATQLVINPVTPSSSNYSNLFSISGTGSHAYTGESQNVAVAWKSPYTACTGVITVKYDGSETAPTNAGSYPITISVASGTNNNASASDIEIGTLTITPIDQSTAVTISNSGTHCIPSLGSYVDISASGGDTSEALTYSVVGTPSSGISLSDGRISATKAGSITVTATRPGGANYNDKTSSNFTFTFVVTPTSVSVTPASPVTHTLPSSVTTPSVTQSATATHTGNRTAWTLSPNYTVNTISDASATNPTSTFKREGVYTATVGVGCNNTTDVSSNSATITVEPPLTIYLSGTLVSSAQDAFGDNNFPMTRTEGSYVYTRRFNAVAGSSAATNDRKFSLRESNSSGQADYLIPKYAKVTYTNITTTGVNNDMYTTGITYSAGNTLEVRAEYKGYNSSENKPEWDISIGLVCDAPDSKTISISSESICRGSDVSVVVNSSQSGYIYTVYDAGNTQVGTTTGDGTNKSISVTRPTESTTYTVKAKQAASCTPTEMANTVSVTVNDIPTFSPTSGITQYLPVTVTSDASSPSWTFNKESGSLDGAWLSNTSGAYVFPFFGCQVGVSVLQLLGANKSHISFQLR